jgi:hypothetical protein
MVFTRMGFYLPNLLFHTGKYKRIYPHDICLKNGFAEGKTHGAGEIESA